MSKKHTGSHHHQHAPIELKYVFGLKGSIKNNVYFMDEHSVIYPSGNNIVIHNSEHKTQQFIPGTETSSGITHLTVSSNKRYLAIVEQEEKLPSISIIDLTTLKRRKTLNFPDSETTSVVSLAFSPDSKILLAQGGSPEYNLVAWSWEKGKTLATIKSSNSQGSAVVQADFCQSDSTLVCVSGTNLIKFFKISDGAFRLQQNTIKRDLAPFVCHTWLSDDRVVAASESGELWLFENFEFKLILTGITSTTENDKNTCLIHSLLAYSKGFVVGGSAGTLRIFERSEETREYYRLSKTFSTVGDTTTTSSSSGNITSMSASPTEDTLVTSFDTNQIFTLNLANADILKEDAMNFELLSTEFHASSSSEFEDESVTGLDVCIRKPLVATCGIDKSLKIWNYVERTIDISKTFETEAYSVSLHPSGLHVLVGFADKLQLLNLLMDEIRPVKDFAIKKCENSIFSHGGQFFAAVSSVHNVIQVYGTYSYENVATFRGHNSTISTLAWKSNDRKLVSVGNDGQLLLWNIKTGEKDRDAFSLPKTKFLGLTLTTDLSSAFVATQNTFDQTVTSIVEVDVISNIVRSECAIGNGIVVGPMVLSGSQKLLFVGVSDTVSSSSCPSHAGTIRAYKLPLVSNGVMDFVQVQCHDRPVTRMALSFDHQFLFSASADGSLCILETRENKNSSSNASNNNANQFAEEILVTRSDLQEQGTLMTELKNQVEELTLHNEYQLRLKDMSYKEKIKEVSEKFTAELKQDRERFFELRDDKRDMELEYEEKLKQLEEKRQLEIQELEKAYQSKVDQEAERYNVLQRSRDEQNAKWEDENQSLVEDHTQFLGRMTAEYDAKLEDELALQASIVKEKEASITEFEAAKELIEEDADLEITELKARYSVKLETEREATLRLKGENGIMKKKFSALQKDIEDQREEIRSLEDKEKELIENIKGLEKDITGHKKEIREREETIQDKEQRIYDLKKKNQELEKFKFVLDYKIKELKRQIEPRENEIADMKKQIDEMDLELEQYHRSNSALDLMIGELRLKMEGMQKEINQQNIDIANGNALIRRFQTDVHNLVSAALSDKKTLKTNVVTLYKKYVQDDASSSSGAAGADVSAQVENNRQREYLEKSVESLKRKIAKDMEMHNSEVHRLMRENAALTKESNTLRREFHAVSQDLDKVNDETANVRGKKKVLGKEARAVALKVAQSQKDEILQLETRLSQLQKAFGGPVAPEKVMLDMPSNNNNSGAIRQPTNVDRQQIDA